MTAASPALRSVALAVQVGSTSVCEGLSFAVHPGQLWALLGRNGAGKTTLLHTLAGLRAPASGRIELQGKALATLTRRQVAQQLGLLLQDAHDPFPSTVLETALIGRHPHLRPWQLESADDQQRAETALRKVGMEKLAQRSVDTLSGGERRRLALASLLCQDPLVGLLDEPTNHLDLHYQIRILELLTESVLHTGRCAIMSLHDVNLAARFCTHALLLYGDGSFDLGPCNEVLTLANLERLYGHPMLQAEHGAQRYFMPV